MHEFQYDADQPGIVKVRENADVEFKSVNLFAPGITADMVRNPDGVKLLPLTNAKFNMSPRPVDAARQVQLDVILKHYGDIIGTKDAYQGPCTV